MSKILFLDFETDSLDPQLANVLEAGVAVYSDRGRLLRAGSEVFNQPKYNLDSLDFIDLTLRDVEMGLHHSSVQRFLEPYFLDEVSAVVTHNGLHYDLKILDRFDGKRLLSGKTLVDSMFDISFSHKTTSRRLTHLCSDHGIVTPHPHGALYDCLYLADLFFKYDVEETIKRANTPMVWVRADVTKQNKDLAKKHGFRWDYKGFIWYKRIRLFDREKLLEAVGNDFQVLRLEDNYTPPKD